MNNEKQSKSKRVPAATLEEIEGCRKRWISKVDADGNRWQRVHHATLGLGWLGGAAAEVRFESDTGTILDLSKWSSVSVGRMKQLYRPTKLKRDEVGYISYLVEKDGLEAAHEFRYELKPEAPTEPV